MSSQNPSQRTATPLQLTRKGRWQWSVTVGILLLVPLILVGCFSSNSQEPKKPDPSPTKDSEQEGTDNPDKPIDDKVIAQFPATLTIELGDGVTMEFVLINPKSKPDGGTFLMGSPKDEKDRETIGLRFEIEKQHLVTLTKPFYLAKYPVTQDQYTKLIGMNPSWFQKGGKGADALKGVKDQDTSRFPVEMVSWEEATSFCKAMTKKHSGQMPAPLREQKYHFALPTEAQWEYACRAGTKTAYFFGDDPGKLGEYAWFGPNSDKRTHEVGEKNKPNAWGFHDMHGNVHQCCEDYYGPYDLKNPDPVRKIIYFEDFRVTRGSSWLSIARECRAAFRRDVPPDICINLDGLRVSIRMD
jgi:formylglycine-generating enzyme required for sulfatase activity